MGARGPAPKDPATRQRRNKNEAEKALFDDNPLPAGEVPELQSRRDGDGAVIPWQPIAEDYWRELWLSPMAGQWTRSDVYRVWMYLDLFDRYVQTRAVDLLSELRLQGTALGIAPMDRQRLHWTTKRNAPEERTSPKPPERAPRTRAPLSVIRNA